MYIDVRVPYEPNKQLGFAYNRAMETVQQWVAFHDDDVFMRTQPKWYQICCEVIRTHGEKAGMFVGVTNRIGCPQQRCADAPRSDDIIEHIEYAERRFAKHGYTVVEIPRVKPSGFFFMTSKMVWEKAGAFPPGFLGVDNRYAEQVKRAGFKVYLIEGLYLYHSYRREWRLSKD